LLTDLRQAVEASGRRRPRGDAGPSTQRTGLQIPAPTPCDTAHEALTGPILSRLHWSVPDPVRIGTDAAYIELPDRVDRVALVLASGDAAPFPIADRSPHR
jgi:hypothetical protein